MSGSTVLNNNSQQTSMSISLKDEPGFPIFVKKFRKLIDLQNASLLKQVGGVEELAKGIGVHLNFGLDTSLEGQERFSLQDREEVFGKNLALNFKARTLFPWTKAIHKSRVLLPLSIAAMAIIVLGFSFEEERENLTSVDGIAVFASILLIFSSSYALDNQLLQTREEMNRTQDMFDVTVIRNGTEKLIKNVDLVVGDVLVLTKDVTVAADGLLFVCNDLFINEEIVTGESKPVKKKLNEDPFCRSGTQVTNGSGKILVTAVGEESEIGKTMKEVAKSTDFADNWISGIKALFFWQNMAALFLGIISFIVLLIRWRGHEHGFPIDEIDQKGPVEFLILAIVIVVVELPEGYIMFDLFSFVFSSWNFAKDNVYIRNPNALWWMPYVKSICFDKTGTLTANKMTVVKGWFHGTYFNELPNVEELDPRTLELITENASLNSEAFLNIENGHVQYVGNQTECSLLVMTERLEVDYSEVRQQNEEQKIKDYIFNSDKKMSSAVLKYGDVLRLYNKGAAEMVLDKCTEYVDPSGFVDSISEVERHELEKVIETMAQEGLRTLALTYADLDPTDFNFGENGEPLEESIGDKRGFEEAPEENLVLLAIVGIRDPVREGVFEVVKQFKNAGIVVRMITGDNISTAKRVATECGILTSDGLAIEGREFRRRVEEDVEDLKRDLPKLQVMARSSPSDKQNLVKLLDSLNEKVAVAGDGTNDARAFKESSVGFAMGIDSSDVAREAADVVVRNDHVSSILTVYLWSRRFESSMFGYMVFRFTVSYVVWIVVLVAVFFGSETPLNVHQIIWANFIIDKLVVLTFATERPPAEVSNDDRLRERSFYDNAFLVNTILQSLYQIIAMFCTIYSSSSLFERYSQGGRVMKMRKNSLIFNMFIFMQLFNALNCRKLYRSGYNIFEGLFDSPFSCGVRTITIVLHVLIMVTPLRDLFKLSELNAWEWLYSMAVSIGVLAIGSITRYIATEERIIHL